MEIGTEIKALFTNIIFLSTITSLCLAQIIKMIVYLIGNKHKKIEEAIETAMWRTGGMPSSHSAAVCALATSTGIIEGISSNLFVFCLVFSVIVLRDSLGVRRAAGLQAKALNTLGKQSSEKIGVEFNSVKEVQGHAPLEVFIGSLLGILMAVLFYVFSL